tara:strand:+ start:328 stop:483 length:156 start_codon:yes stop_codon:yes gene_type:complete
VKRERERNTVRREKKNIYETEKVTPNQRTHVKIKKKKEEEEERRTITHQQR